MGGCDRMWKLVEGGSVVGREMEGWAEKVDRERKMEGEEVTV